MKCGTIGAREDHSLPLELAFPLAAHWVVHTSIIVNITTIAEVAPPALLCLPLQLTPPVMSLPAQLLSCQICSEARKGQLDYFSNGHNVDNDGCGNQ